MGRDMKIESEGGEGAVKGLDIDTIGINNFVPFLTEDFVREQSHRPLQPNTASVKISFCSYHIFRQKLGANFSSSQAVEVCCSSARQTLALQPHHLPLT